MRRFFLAASLALLSLVSSANAQNETATVTAESLPGLWKIGFPAWSYRTFTNVQFGPVQDDFCRLAGTRDNLNLACLYVRFRAGGKVQRGAVTLKGDSLRVVWGTLMARATLDLAKQPSGIFTGYYTAQILFIPYRAPEQLRASKIMLSENIQDADGKSALLTKLLNSIAEGVPVQSLAQLRENVEPPTADDLRTLGRLDSVIYLGRTPSSAEEAALYKDFPSQKEETPPESAPPQPPSEVDASSVYAAEFEKGERLCAIYQRPDGVVEDLRCI